jgi:hypothetical protein
MISDAIEQRAMTFHAGSSPSTGKLSAQPGADVLG